MLQFRDLTEKDIEIRVAQIGETGNGNMGWASLLLYKDARVDMNILDETVGPENWQRRHYECKGNLYCSVGIKCGDEWIWKDDCGAESFAEKQKGEASDSFKRACVNWGIGRELYTAEPIFVNIPVKKNKKGTIVPDGEFQVEKIKIEKKEIVGLAIRFVNADLNKRVYLLDKQGA